MGRTHRRRSGWARIVRGLAMVVALPGVVGCADFTGPVPVHASAPTAEGAEFMSLLNEQRMSVGCAPLEWHEGAAQVAWRHSADMARRGYFDHVSPEGATVGDRLSEAGIDYAYVGENIAAGQSSVEQVFDAWMGSDGHRRNMESCDFTQHGLGREGTMWTLVLFVPR